MLLYKFLPNYFPWCRQIQPSSSEEEEDANGIPDLVSDDDDDMTGLMPGGASIQPSFVAMPPSPIVPELNSLGNNKKKTNIY